MQHVAVLAYFICLFLTCFDEIRAACPKRSSLNTNRTMDTKMWRHVFKVISDILSPYQCADACLRDARCKSFNYKRKQDKTDFNECELNDVKWNDTEYGEVGDKPGSDLYDVDFERLHEDRHHQDDLVIQVVISQFDVSRNKASARATANGDDVRCPVAKRSAACAK